jgi:hypothetical protein
MAQPLGGRDLPPNHHAANLHQGDAPGILGIPLPTSGTDALQSVHTSLNFIRNYGGAYPVDHQEEHAWPHAPKIKFLKFDGENPKLWQQ